MVYAIKLQCMYARDLCDFENLAAQQIYVIFIYAFLSDKFLNYKRIADYGCMIPYWYVCTRVYQVDLDTI